MEEFYRAAVRLHKTSLSFRRRIGVGGRRVESCWAPGPPTENHFSRTSGEPQVIQKPERDRDILAVVATSLRIVGVYVTLNTRNVVLKAASIILPLLSIGFQLSHIGLVVFGLMHSTFQGFLLSQLSQVLSSICALVCGLSLLLSARRIHWIRVRAIALLASLPDKGAPCHRSVATLSALGWIYMVARFAAVAWVLDNQVPREAFKNVYGVEPSATSSPRYLSLLVGLHWYLSSLFTTGTLVFVPIYYMAFCLVLIHAFHVHNQRLRALYKERANVLIADDLATIRAFYERICALALDVNSAFGKVVFAWYIKIVLSICVDVTQLFSDHELLESENQEETFLFSLRMLYSFLTFLGTCIAAAQVSESAQHPLPILHTLTLRSSRLDMNTKMEAHFFLSRLTASPVVLTGWDFFVISRSFILSVAAAVTTYIVIMIQMNPKAMRTINRLVSTALNSTTNSTTTVPTASLEP